MGKTVVIASLLVLAACTNVTPIRMPDGNMGYSISCPPAEGGTACIQKAGELCPAGYQIASQGGTTMSSFYANGGFFYGSSVTRPQMMVECNGASNLLATPLNGSEADPPSYRAGVECDREFGDRKKTEGEAYIQCYREKTCTYGGPCTH